MPISLKQTAKDIHVYIYKAHANLKPKPYKIYTKNKEKGIQSKD